ncbi:MAG: prolipoprotein diacylglyceryl transferase [Thiomargarita sp.]|nr:prolipoprotein diacylglyceryl transferase [Thiomargarita sp.]
MYPTFNFLSVTFYTYGIMLSAIFTVLFLWVYSVCPKNVLTPRDFYVLFLFALVSIISQLFINKELGTYPILITAILLTLPYLYLRQKSILKVFDFLIPYVLLAIASQRLLGCFFAGCCYGHPTDLPWGMMFHPSSVAWEHFQVPLHPTQLYYGFPLLVMSIILLIWRQKFYRGIPTSLGGITIGSVYFLVHFMRGDVRSIGSYTLMHNQYYSLAFILIGFLLLFIIRIRIKK